MPQKPIEVYYWPTPNGKKVTILLEECGLHVGADIVRDELTALEYRGDIAPAQMIGACAISLSLSFPLRLSCKFVTARSRRTSASLRTMS